VKVALTAVSIVSALLAGASAVTTAALAARPTSWELRDCRTRGEGASPRQPPAAEGVRIGPLVIWPSVRRPASSTGDPVWPFQVKAPVVLAAGSRVVLTIASEAASTAAFQRTSRQGYATSVRFEACSAGARAHAYDGTVGKLTGFPFAIGLTRRSACIPLELWIDGQVAPLRRTIPVGRSSC
jgi:hypothetical protein